MYSSFWINVKYTEVNFVNHLLCVFFFFQLILNSVLNALYESVSQILRKNVEKRALLENLDAAFLVLDEICDGG